MLCLCGFVFACTGFTIHLARHTWRTIAAHKGIRDTIAERIMGHAEGNDIKDIYTHPHDEDIVAEMAEKWVVKY
ncbi:hypothetical protein AGMMS49574_22220 [Bacteroidia bacterium]|nr:hypothetical protein AGMMS49574_22220 [Bacteroidia bacterium]